MKRYACLSGLVLCGLSTLAGAALMAPPPASPYGDFQEVKAVPISNVTLNATFTVDDSYHFYLSPDDSVLGKEIGWDEDWYGAESYSVNLTPKVTQYIHVVANDAWKCIAGFMGQFTLKGTGLQFANGTQTLVTNADDWKVSRIGFGQKYEQPDVVAQNGEGIWASYSTFKTISAKAQWLWTDGGKNFTDTHFFSAAIVPTGSVPEPTTLAILLIGSTFYLHGRK